MSPENSGSLSLSLHRRQDYVGSEVSHKEVTMSLFFLCSRRMVLRSFVHQEDDKDSLLAHHEHPPLPSHPGSGKPPVKVCWHRHGGASVTFMPRHL